MPRPRKCFNKLAKNSLLTKILPTEKYLLYDNCTLFIAPSGHWYCKGLLRCSALQGQLGRPYSCTLLPLLPCLAMSEYSPLRIYTSPNPLCPPSPFLHSRFLSLSQIKGYWDDFLEYCPVTAGKEKASSESFVQLWKAVPPQ